MRRKFAIVYEQALDRCQRIIRSTADLDRAERHAARRRPRNRRALRGDDFSIRPELRAERSGAKAMRWNAVK